MNYSQSVRNAGKVLLTVLTLGVMATGVALAGSGTRYYLNDHLATTVGIVDAAGEIAALEADAYGTPITAGANPGRYTGKPYDEDIGAYVFPFRNYRAEEARWMSADPGGFPDGLNGRYYAPSIFLALDPLGLAKHLLWLFLEDASRPNDPAIGEMHSGYNTLYHDLEHADTLSSNPRYLNDGDSFSFISASNFQFLSGSGIGVFTKIYVVAHGYLLDDGVIFAVGGSFYTESEIKAANSKIDLFHGCFSTASGGHEVKTGAVVSAWKMPTRNYLYE